MNERDYCRKIKENFRSRQGDSLLEWAKRQKKRILSRD